MSIYKSYTRDEIDNLNSQFLVTSWGYSKVTTFARNEKAFEMSYVYGYAYKSSATTIAGQAYHAALDSFFTVYKEMGICLDIVSLEKVAHSYIQDVEGHKWKIQKTTPNIESATQKALKTVTQLLKNFLSEVDCYLGEIEEVLEVEVSCNEFLTINGVDIPLPCRSKIDLVAKTKDGKVVIIDHKSKHAFSDEKELAFSIGIQAITYVASYESKTSLCVDEVWFIENKYSENRNKSEQLQKFKVKLNDDNRRLYEALLYEPLKRMITAVNDPDYIYLINDADNYIDKAELYEFWAKTMIAEVEDFMGVPANKQSLIRKRLKKIRDASLGSINPKVIKEFKTNAAQFIQYDLSNKDMTQEEKIEHVLRSFGAIIKVAHKLEGFSSDTYLLEVSAGVKVASIQNHKLDLANALNVSTVRISKELVVYAERSYLAIEISKKRDKDLNYDPAALVGFKIPLGKDNFGNTIVWDHDNHSTPHALACGATGSGKSVLIKSIIESCIAAKITKIVIFDPKYEFIKYAKNHKITVLNDILDIENEMSKLVDDMNYLVKKGETRRTLVIFDEFADAVAQARKGKQLDVMKMVQVGETKVKGMFGTELVPKMQLKKVDELKSLEENLKIILQKGRSSGFRVLAATQRASVKVITGDAKVNFPVQICFRVPKAGDSMVVLDEVGAESLAGGGDGLIKSPEYQETTRFQAYYIQ